MSKPATSQGIKTAPELTNIFPTHIHSIRRNLSFFYLPKYDFSPQHRTEGDAPLVCCAACGTQLAWMTTMFTSENSFVLGDRRWLWRRRAETEPEVIWIKCKLPPKVMIFAGIVPDHQSRPIVLETADTDASIDELADQSAIIPYVNGRQGPKQWKHMQDWASIHIAAATMTCLTMVVNVLPGWPDLNRIEKLSAILKRRIEELGYETKEELIHAVKEDGYRPFRAIPEIPQLLPSNR
jgi:hypothetical protein